MENKENKDCAAELNDEALRDVNGGLVAVVIGPNTSESQEP